MSRERRTTTVFLLLDGVLDVEVDGETVAEVGPGTFVGERAAVEGGARTATLRAMTPCRVVVLESEMLRKRKLTELAYSRRKAESLIGSPSCGFRAEGDSYLGGLVFQGAQPGGGRSCPRPRGRLGGQIQLSSSSFGGCTASAEGKDAVKRVDLRLSPSLKLRFCTFESTIPRRCRIS